jgi:predicted HD phosphohydrolase
MHRYGDLVPIVQESNAFATVFDSVDELLAHLASLGRSPSMVSTSRRYTDLDHGLQTAAILAASHPDDTELQVAGLIHDLAHPWDGAGQSQHGVLGAQAVRKLLGHRVARLIESHIDAKRYLVAVRPDYRDRLSEGSAETLIAQGAAMSRVEVTEFEQRLDHQDAIALRLADDLAKVPCVSVPGLDAWEPVIRALVL